jgi:hypothetical protein
MTEPLVYNCHPNFTVIAALAITWSSRVTPEPWEEQSKDVSTTLYPCKVFDLFTINCISLSAVLFLYRVSAWVNCVILL